jgi:hypothetical protein
MEEKTGYRLAAIHALARYIGASPCGHKATVPKMIADLLER